VTTVQAGTAAAPAITTSGDTNTGIFFPAADTIAFSEGGVEAMRIASDGNVGIGTSSPNKLLTLNSVTNDVEVLRINAFGGSGGIQAKADIGFGYFDTSAEASAAIGFEEFGTASNGGILLFKTRPDSSTSSTRPTERMRLDSSGNLGLGVTPSAWGQGRAIEVFGQGYGIWNGTASIYSIANAYFNSGFKYANTGAQASHYYQFQGAHVWSTAPSGTAGNAITFTQAATLTANGEYLVGLTSATGVAKLQVSGPIRTTGYTVATLPAGTVGMRTYVTDALAPSFGVAVAGSGAVTIPVFYNGTNWIVA
jgi:hypothetical protein